MDEQRLREILEAVQAGKTSAGQALESLRGLPFEKLDFAHFDTHREVRTGIPEVIYAPGKTEEQVLKLTEVSLEKHGRVLITRVEEALAEEVVKQYPACTYADVARIIYSKGAHSLTKTSGKVVIVTGGTSDIPVAEEAAVTLDYLGTEMDSIRDVGVAGLHRLAHYRDQIQASDVVIAVAGMEGALASVVAGITDRPVVAVPTSVGYGASFKGLSALLTMLNSCASGVAVVNIDNGFGAAVFAQAIMRRRGGCG